MSMVCTLAESGCALEAMDRKRVEFEVVDHDVEKRLPSCANSAFGIRMKGSISGSNEAFPALPSNGKAHQQNPSQRSSGMNTVRRWPQERCMRPMR